MRRTALEPVAVPRDADLPALLRLVREAVYEGTVLREPLFELPLARAEPAVESDAEPGTEPDADLRRGLWLFVPTALGVGLREAWRDHVRAQRGGMTMDLADYGRGLGTTATDRTTVLWLVPWLRHGGAEAVLANVLAGLGDRYHFVICTTIDITHDWRPWFRELGCEVFVLPELLPRSAWAMFLERLIEAKKVSALVNAHSQYGYDIAARLRAHLPLVRFARPPGIQRPNPPVHPVSF